MGDRTAAVPILMYHSIADVANPRFKRYTVPPPMFAKQVEYLDHSGYTPITVSRFVSLMDEASDSAPTRPILLTFDDGFADFRETAMPVLAQFGFPATLFVTTGFVDGTSEWLAGEGEGKRRMVGWSHLSEILMSGVEVGAHSHSHPQLDIISSATAQQEIRTSKARLEDQTGRAITSFAYPHGHYSRKVRSMVQAAGYSSACAVRFAMSSWSDDRFALSRLEVRNDTNVAELARLLTGSYWRPSPVLSGARALAWRLLRRILAHQGKLIAEE